jgi:predicted ATPase
MEALRGYPEESHVPQDLYHLRADGSNLAGILNYYKGSIASSKDLDMLLERIRTITPEIDDIGPRFQGEDKAKLFVKLKKNKETYTFTPESMSTGSLDAIFLTLALQIFGEGSIYLLDGPDSHLHAGSQESMLDLLRKVAVSESKQFIIATHSPFIVDMCSTDELFLVTRDGFRTSVEKISDKKEILDALETTDVKISDFTSSMHKV